jgi:hypothetical protein
MLSNKASLNIRPISSGLTRREGISEGKVSTTKRRKGGKEGRSNLMFGML